MYAPTAAAVADAPPKNESFAARRTRLQADLAARNEAATVAVTPPVPPPPQTAAELVERAGDLAALPQVVMQVIALTGTTDASAGELERIIASDPAMTARLLTLANSSYYGLPRRISTLREAVIFLGFKTVRHLATTITAFNLFLGKSDGDSLMRRDLWKHSLNAGLCGKLIASAVPNAGVSAEVFTAALLHDIGKSLIHQHLKEPYAHAARAAAERGVPFHAVEREFLPFTHAEAGALLATRWNLPAVLVEAIGHHHTPGQAEADPHTCAAVALASDFANAFGGSTAPSPDTAGTAETPRPVLSLNEEAVVLLGLRADALHRLSGACAAELRAGSALTSLF